VNLPVVIPTRASYLPSIDCARKERFLAKLGMTTLLGFPKPGDSSTKECSFQARTGSVMPDLRSAANRWGGTGRLK
jgi:hypothetical protein